MDIENDVKSKCFTGSICCLFLNILLIIQIVLKPDFLMKYDNESFIVTGFISFILSLCFAKIEKKLSVKKCGLIFISLFILFFILLFIKYKAGAE